MINYSNSSLKALGIAMMIFFIFSCNSSIKFEKEDWAKRTDPIEPSPSRNRMLTDLTTNHKLVGLSTSELVKYLGPPDNRDSSLIIYQIDIDYGGDTDPVYSKSLQFTFSKDSVVKSFKVVEWKK